MRNPKVRDWANGEKTERCGVRGIADLEKVPKFQYDMWSFWPSHALILFQVHSSTLFDFFSPSPFFRFTIVHEKVLIIAHEHKFIIKESSFIVY